MQLLPWDGRVEGLGPAGDMPVAHRRLDEAAGEAVEGAELVSQGPRLLIEEGTVLGPHALQAAWAAVQGSDEALALRLDGRSGELLGSIELGQGAALGFVPDGQGDRSRIRGVGTLRIPAEERVLDLPLPGGPVAISDRFAVRVRHAQQLLWANLLSLPPVLWRELAGEGLMGPLRIAWAALRAGSLRHELLAARLSRSEGARVHPSAVVEASLVLPGAVVEAGAVVRGSVLGEGARVEALAICEGSVLGPGAVVQRQALARYCLLGPGAMLGGTTQLSVLGTASALKRGSFAMDQGLSAEVRVPVDGRLVEAPLGLAGCCLGPRTQVGSGIWIAPGRMLPSDLVVLGAQALTDPHPPAEARLVQVRDGKLESG